MATRKPVRPERNPLFEDNAPPPALTDYAEDVFGEARKKEEKRQFARPLSIMSITPDPVQPRRALPSEVRQRWDGQPATLPQAFDLWLELAERESRRPIDLSAFVLAERERDDPADELAGPLEAALLALADLAANVRLNGLTNSITVVRLNDGYQIETGERRWLAHHLLYEITGDDRWLFIAARVVENINVWRQAGENSARANLNAISRARQFALLLMDLHNQSPNGASPHFAPFDELVTAESCDRAYYAQVADSDRFRIPTGKADQMLNAMGLKSRAAFSRYRAMLQLPDEVWKLGDDLNWSDDRLYLLASMDAKQAVLRAREMRRRDDARRRRPNVLSQNISDDDEPQFYHVLDTGEFRKRVLRVARMADRIGALSDDKRRKGLEEIRAVRRWLDELERLFRRETSI